MRAYDVLSKVFAFYYRYLAAAEPLTDVVYGPKVKFEIKVITG